VISHEDKTNQKTAPSLDRRGFPATDGFLVGQRDETSHGEYDPLETNLGDRFFGEKQKTGRAVKTRQTEEERKAKKKARAAAWYLANKERVCATTTAYQRANPKKVRATKAKYRKDNHEKICAQSAEYRKANAENVRAGIAAWQKNNPEKVKAIKAKWYKSHAERARAVAAAYRNNNPEKALAASKNWRKSHPKEVRARENAYRKAHPEKVAAKDANRRARKHNAGGCHTGEEVKQLLARQKCLCAVCKKSIESGYHVDHVVPLARGGSNYIRNIQLLCPTCNLRKGHKDPLIFMQSMGFLL